MTEYIYIFKVLDLYKVGRSQNIEKRLRNYSDSPIPVDFVFAAKVENSKGLEAQLHGRYESSKVNGEWFRLNSSQLDEVKAYLSELGTAYIPQRLSSVTPRIKVDESNSEDISTFGQFIKRKRKQSGLSQQRLADACGFAHRSAILRLEQDRLEWKLKEVTSIAELFGLSASQLLAEFESFKVHTS